MVKFSRPQPPKSKPKQLSHPADRFICTEPLGAIYQPEATTFRVFAPTAHTLKLHLYQAPLGGSATVYSMEKREADGSWDVTIRQDCLGLYYTFTANGDDPSFNPHQQLIDPYARAVTAHNGRAIVVHDTTPVTARPAFPRSQAIIYEMHLRDFTIDPDSSIQRRGKYLALTESNTHLQGRPDILTGIEHLSELGINTVQLMPISEFNSDESADEYGWGYDSVHFNTPDGWYASERFDARRVSEVKRMIDAFHRRGIRVVLDVVYNHTNEYIQHRVYSFEGLVPGYYYRRKLDGNYWNGSGVGNEFRSEAPMARRFIIDSLKYWVNEYQVDGFRFDLMGLIDQETLTEATRELHAIDANLLIYGEPWAAGDTPIQVSDKGRQRGCGYGVFNDHFRDALKGGVFKPRETGYVQAGNNLEAVKKGIIGSLDDFAAEPIESINYVECHDNHTFWDRLMISTLEDSRITDADRRAMDKLGALILFTSQGIPFIQSGQEFLRSKGGDSNSYLRPDAVNMLRWQLKSGNYDIFLYYRGLIAIRKAHRIFQLSSQQIRTSIKFLDSDLEISLAERTIGYLLSDPTGQDSWARALVLLNPNNYACRFPIPEGDWQIYVDDRHASLLPSHYSRVLLQNNLVTLPPRCGVLLAEELKK